MTKEEAKQFLSTRQLTDYLTDWPEDTKGCLWLHKSEYAHYSLMIVDTPWREGAQWDDYPKLLPYEQKILDDKNTRVVSDFGAILMAYALTWPVVPKEDERKEGKRFKYRDVHQLFTDDVNLLWEAYQEEQYEQNPHFMVGEMYLLSTFYECTNESRLALIHSIIRKSHHPREITWATIKDQWFGCVLKWTEDYIKNTPVQSMMTDSFSVGIDAPNCYYDLQAEDEQGNVLGHIEYTPDYGDLKLIDDELILCLEVPEKAIVTKKGDDIVYEWVRESMEYADTYAKGLAAYIVNYCTILTLWDNLESKRTLSNLLQLHNYAYVDIKKLQISMDVETIYRWYYDKKVVAIVKELKRKAAYITQDEHGKRVMEAQEIIKQEKQNAAECTLLLEALPDEKRKELQDYLEAFYVWCENQFRTTTDSSGGMHFHAPVGQVVANVEHQTLRSE